MSRRYDDNPLMNHNYNGNRGPSWKKVLGISLSVILGIVAIGGGVIYYVGHNLISLSNYVADEEVKVVEELPEEAQEETLASDERQGVVLDEEQLNSLHEKMSNLNTVETKEDENVYNLLLVGVDRRDKSWNGNSDSMMLVSINHKAKRVSVVSLMRDTYVDIAGVGYAKLNAAYAYGGGPLLTSTITDTYKVDVSRYAAVDF